MLTFIRICYFLKRWQRTQRATKVRIGRFYIAIDRNLQAKDCRPDNTYRFIQRVVESNLSRNTRMNYGFQEQELKSTWRLGVKVAYVKSNARSRSIGEASGGCGIKGGWPGQVKGHNYGALV